MTRRFYVAKRLNRSGGGTVTVFFVLAIFGAFMATPMIYTIVQAFKPLEEIFIFPPRLYVVNPTLRNFQLMGQLANSLWVPFSRYVFNSIFVALTATAGNVVLASMAAYPLAKHNFPGRKLLFKMVTISLLFHGGVMGLAQYIIMAELGMIDTYWALILPSTASTLGLFLMRQFMTQIQDSMLEASRIDGANEMQIFARIVMPMVKPAWMTQILFAFQAIWGMTGANIIFTENLKLFPTVLNQIAAGGIARSGVGSAASLILILPPVVVFLVTQSKIMETMAHSGIKE